MPAQTKITRILMVDDNPSIHRHVIGLLPEEFEVVETLEDGAGLPAAVASHQPDVILLDITLPVLSGIQIASQLRVSGQETPIIFLTVHNDPDYARAAFAVGAHGYVLKIRLVTDLIPALRAAMTGQKFLSPPLKLEDVQ